jgi:hypothetical protein
MGDDGGGAGGAPRHHAGLRPLRRGAVTLVVAVVLAWGTVFVERVGPAPPGWRDELCSPFPLHPCGEGVLQGGWPFAYLLDKPGISVMASLGLIEDRFETRAFLADVVAFWVALLGIGYVAGSRRRSATP